MPFLGPNISALVRKHDLAALLKLLQRDDVHVRREVIRALGDLGDRAAVPALTAILANDRPRVSEQIDAAEALGKIADPAAVDAMMRANAASITREKAAIEEATAPKENRYRPGFYINQISADEYTLRTHIANALSQVGTVPALAALFEMLANESGWMEGTARESISQAIARMLKRDDTAQAQFLLATLTHAAPIARKWAAYYLRNFSGAEIVKALMDVAWNEKEEFGVRQDALGTLGRIADEKNLPDLDELARSANRVITRLASDAAIEIRSRMDSPRATTGVFQ